MKGVRVVIGLILAAGAGERLRPHTERLPKTLVPIGDNLTILDVILRNLAIAGLSRAVIVVGHAAAAVEERRSELAVRHGIGIDLIRNDHPQWNNCYSLWLARHAYSEGAVLVNGDTVHPVEVEEVLLARRGPGLLLAVDVDRPLTDEAMKVLMATDGRIRTVSKGLSASTAHGEYIGASLIEAGFAGELTTALEETWRADPGRYYEDGYQALVDSGCEVFAVPLPALSWVEVDDAADLAIAREIACRC
jgi:choline kinase